MSEPETADIPRIPALTNGIERAALVLFVASSAMLPLVAGTDNRSLQIVTLTLEMAAAFLWLLKMIFDGRLALPWGKAPLAGALVLAAAAVSAAFATAPQTAISTLIVWIGYAAAFLFAFWAGRDPGIRRLLARVLCAAALPVAVFGILQYAFILDLTAKQIKENEAEVLKITGFSEREIPNMLQRATSKRVFSTFALPNTLACYLLIAIPPTIALAVSARGRVRRAVLIGSILLLVLCLFLTFSKGGWLAAAALLALFLLTRGRPWLRGHWRAALAAAVAGELALGAALGASHFLRQRLVAMSHELGATAQVRVQYWAAAAAMYGRHPLLGVGPGNFRNYYMMYKLPAAEEVKDAHNEYVQMLAECGPIALAGYAAFWALILASLARRRPAEPAEPPPAPRSPAPPSLPVAAGVAGIVAAELLGGPFDLQLGAFVHVGLTAAMALLWWAAYHASASFDEAAAPPRALLTGLAFGLLAFALHSFIDINMRVDAVGFLAFAGAGLAASTRVRRIEVRLSGGRRLGLLVAAALLAFGFFFVASRVSEADAYRTQGVMQLRAADRITGDVVRSAERSFEQARASNPLDDATFAGLAYCGEQEFTHTGDGEALDRAVRSWQRAIELNPSLAGYHQRLSALFLLAGRRTPYLMEGYAAGYAGRAAELDLPAPPDPALAPALVEAALAVRCAPTTAQDRMFYGDALWQARLRPEAAGQYRAALDLNRRMQQGGAPARQWLTPVQVKAIEEKLALTAPPSGAIIPQ